jgi:hypothetical protein
LKSVINCYTKIWENVVSLIDCIDKSKNTLPNVKEIFSCETAWPNGAKLGIDGPWVCPFQNCVRQPHPPFKMAAVFKGNLAEFFVIVQTCVFSSLATTKNDTYSYCIFG